MVNVCTKYGFDSLIISGSYGRHRQHTRTWEDGRRTSDNGPTGELKCAGENMSTKVLPYLIKLCLEC